MKKETEISDFGSAVQEDNTLNGSKVLNRVYSQKGDMTYDDAQYFQRGFV